MPLVNRSALLDFARATVDEARRELIAEGLPFGADVPFGAMIEATAAVPLAGSWAGRVDFFALGTNDLTASALGLSREDPVGARCDDVLHPGLIRMIGSMIDAAHEGGRPVSTCGEMASDPAGTVVLAALGADSLSVAVDRLADVRRILASRQPHGLHAHAVIERRDGVLGARREARAIAVEREHQVLAVPLHEREVRVRERRP